MNILANQEEFPIMCLEGEGRKTQTHTERMEHHPHICFKVPNEAFETVFKLEGNIFV